jgi:hypothetical protein
MGLLRPSESNLSQNNSKTFKSYALARYFIALECEAIAIIINPRIRKANG